MNEEQYLSELEQLLMDVKVKDRLDILRDVSEYFTSGRLEGRSDEEMARELGEPSVLASELLASVDVEESISTRPAAVVKSSVVAFQSVLIQVQNAHKCSSPHHKTVMRMRRLRRRLIMGSSWISSGTL